MIIAYSQILNKFYNFGINTDFSLITKFVDNNDKEKYYQISMNCEFSDIILNGDLPVLSDDDKKIILDNLTDIEILQRYLPPELFEFRGFSIINAFDITDQQILSELKQNLLQKDAILSVENFNQIQSKIEKLLNISPLFINIAAIRDNEVLILNMSNNCDIECLYQSSIHYNIDYFKGSIYEELLNRDDIIIIRDLNDKKNKTDFEKEMLSHGKTNFLIAPLSYNDIKIGFLLIASKESGQINHINSLKLTPIIPNFAVAIRRNLDEFENRVNLLIQQKFTSIHPSVEWKFKDAIIDYINQQDKNENVELNKIIFNNVYPLYNITDIRNSSIHRNSAIQKDILEQLNYLKKIIDIAFSEYKYPLFDEVGFQISQNILNLENGINTGDEIRILKFIKNEVEPLLSEIKNFNTELRNLSDNYFAKTSKEQNSFYEKRKDFDISVQILNNTVSKYIEDMEREAQLMFPHYFDKQLTDGVDVSIYIGASISNSKEFNKFHLKNLRLWQLITLANIVLLLDKIRDKMPVKLETTNLIVVQDMPITICYDIEEKRFRVDGAYNVRYEIMKKRIDKAIIKNKNERLTQPNTISIVYSHENEKEEYLKYIDYLIYKNVLQNEYEHFELEDLQGITGLKALRVTVNYKNIKYIDKSISELLSDAYQKNILSN